MIAPSAEFQESRKIPLPSAELGAKIKALSKFTPFEKIATKIKTVVTENGMKI